ncbi:sterol desaturase family protein [Tautonia plasticadhaerens]|uniref:Fatty acid hydroxylase superfamily protein n=1 Tax=Tautonia plasticadhaerens TaxID=2527974 RepID=A0A518H9M3_9BACT|nr:sterol desaturase family protein [Tautonia plasticadhaerens]QDV37554.1 Fatty acid hydroxylase superfamily protein [Tautonia plasticadhaerens]
MIAEYKLILAPSALALLWVAEGLVPFYSQFRGGFRDRLRHDGRNLSFGLANAALGAVIFAGLFLMAERWAEARGLGLLRRLAWPSWAETLLALVLLDLWMYLWHRANHAVPLLWRFHRMHHSDAEMDATTGIRFHMGEVLLSALARLVLLPIIGMALWQVAAYEAFFAPIVLFHHANVGLPRWVDRGLMALVVTPAMHRVHHSRWRPETDSNYGSVLPWWDRMFRTFRPRDDARTIRLGLDEFDAPEWQGLRGMLETPLAAARRAGTGRNSALDTGTKERRARSPRSPLVDNRHDPTGPQGALGAGLFDQGPDGG